MDENLIKAGDLVYVYLDEKRQYLMEVRPKLKLSTDSGDMDLGAVIGKPFGFCGTTHLGKPCYCLKPTTRDLMMKIKRRTTIAYPKDIGYLLLETSVGPGSKVIEVGTGSGALTLFLAKLTAPGGRVYSYERSEEFQENAKKNLQRSGLADNVEFFLRDIGQGGFLQSDVDAVFIDVPEPWDVVPHAAAALKGGHHVASWSPNVEQVKRTFDALKEAGFIKIKSSEVIERELLVRDRGIRPRERGITHTAYLTSACKIQKI
jgi:tRNA (adenine57-N1/adenine58-N1)-methyltransferase